jgi:hypothetical protein
MDATVWRQVDEAWISQWRPNSDPWPSLSYPENRHLLMNDATEGVQWDGKYSMGKKELTPWSRNVKNSFR